jgi:histidinol-phosphate/aromatic aminotransferase/cobyric acid decarboxylase-like protein
LAFELEFRREHGGISPEQRGRGVLDLSVCICPYDVPDVIQQAIQETDLRSYPDPDNRAGRQALANFCGSSRERLILGNGAAELLWTLAKVCAAGKQVLVARPSFCEFEAAARSFGASIDYCDEAPPTRHDVAPSSAEVLLAERALFVRSWQAALSQAVVRGTPYAAAYLCAPTSPLGRSVAAEDYFHLAREFPETTFIVDQSYLALSHHAHELAATSLNSPHNLVSVRSLTKELGTPGLRIGYALMEPALVKAVAAARPSWTVSAAAEAVAFAYPRCAEVLQARCQAWLALAKQLQGDLRVQGLRVVASDTVYCCVEVPAGWDTAKTLQVALESHGVAVRDCASFGLPRHFRVAAHPEQARLLAALERLPKKGDPEL